MIKACSFLRTVKPHSILKKLELVRPHYFERVHLTRVPFRCVAKHPTCHAGVCVTGTENRQELPDIWAALVGGECLQVVKSCEMR